MIEITTIPDGQPVPGPGFYRMSMEHYHSQACCPGPSVSSSHLRRAWESPADFWAYSDWNPDRFDVPDSPSKALGRAVHALLLGEDVFQRDYIFLPEDAPPRPTATQVAAFERDGHWSEKALPRAKFWTAFEAKAAGRTLLDGTMLEHLKHMVRAVHAVPEADLLIGGEVEVCMIVQDATGLWVKSRPDAIPPIGEALADLKATYDASLRGCFRSIAQRGYDMQMALGGSNMAELMDIDPATIGAALLFVQSGPPYHVSPIEISADALHWGRIKNRLALDRIARCLDTGDWPGPVQGYAVYDTPQGEVERITQLQMGDTTDGPGSDPAGDAESGGLQDDAGEADGRGRTEGPAFVG